jgi:hypothetical protein
LAASLGLRDRRKLKQTGLAFPDKRKPETSG